MAAGTSIFTLMGSIMVDNDKANESISKTEGKAEGLAKKFGEGIKTAGKWGAAIAGAAVAGGTALFGMANKAADTTDRIDKLSQKIGISRTAFQEYEYILSQNGASIEVMQRGMKTLVDRMDESTRGTGKGAEAFDRLKLSATDLNGELKSQEQMFEESAKALMAMPEGAEKSALAFDLFGKAGQELMPLLNGTAEDMDALRDAAHDMGLVLSDEAVDAGALFTDTMDNVKRTLGAVATNIGIQVMPMFQTMLDWVLDHMPEIQNVIGIVFEKIGQFVNIAIDIFMDYLLPAFKSIFDWTQKNWPTIQKVIETVFKAIKTVWDTVLKPTLDLLWNLFKSIVTWFTENWPTISNTVSTVFGVIKSVWDSVLKPTLDLLWNLFKAVVSWVVDNFNGVSNAVSTVFDIIQNIWNTVLKPVLDAIKDAFDVVVQFVKDNFPSMGDTVDTVMNGIKEVTDKVKDSFGWLADKIKDAWDWLTTWNRTDMEDKSSEVTIYETTIKSSVDGGDGSSGGGSGGGTRDGSHRLGLPYVPFDNYKAELHEGERVLTKQENKEYEKGKSGLSINNLNITIPAKDILEFKNVTNFFEKIGQVAKAGVVNG